jgi:hypothetical protein
VSKFGRWARSAAEKNRARQAATIAASGGPRMPQLANPAAAMSQHYTSGQGRAGCRDAQLRILTPMIYA